MSLSDRRTPKLLLAVMAIATLAGDSRAAVAQFDALTSLAEGAVVGENVTVPVPGFDIRVLRHGQPIYHQAFGDWQVDQIAAIDSSTKTLSGALLMSLTETPGLGFSLDSHLGDFLAEFDEGDLASITIRQAFSHTSGIEGSESSAAILSNPLIGLRESARRVAELPLAHEPATTFAYGGLSMQAAGAAAEVAAGVRYVDLFADRITTPLDMTNTSFFAASQFNPRIAGGVQSTATDYSRFMDMLLNQGTDRATGHQVLSPEAVAEMTTLQTAGVETIHNSPTDDSKYGIGVWLDQLEEAGPPVEVMAGGARGFHSWIDIEHNLVFTFATDTTYFRNLELLSSMMHAAILDAIALPGDFNGDGSVNLVDYTVWRNHLGAAEASTLNGNGDGSEIVDAGDYHLWREHFGQTTSLAAAATTSVPEPSSLAVAMFSLVGLYWRQRQ